MVILLFCLLVFGVFVYWRVSATKELVKPDYRAIDAQEEQIHTQTNTYKEPVEDFSKNAREAYKDLE